MTNLENSLTPIVRQRGEIAGVPLTINGETWLLAHGGIYAELDSYRDRMDDRMRLEDTVLMDDVYAAAMILLMINYDVTQNEAIQVLVESEKAEIAKATTTALFGEPDAHRTYSQWVMSALYSAGLDPETIPAQWIPLVLHQLSEAKRIIPVHQFTDAGLAAPQHRQIRARLLAESLKKQAAEAEAKGAANESGDANHPG